MMVAIELNPTINQPIVNRLLSRSLGINRSLDGAAGNDRAASAGIVVQISSRIRADDSAITSSINGLSLIQTAEAGLLQISDSLQQLQQIGQRAERQPLSAEDRASLQQQAEQLLSSIPVSINTTRFDGLLPLAQAQGGSIQIGADSGDRVSIPGFDLLGSLQRFGLGNFSVADFSLTTRDSASGALNSLDQSLSFVASAIAQFGAASKQLDRLSENLQLTTLTQSRSAAVIEDPGLAIAVSRLIRTSLQQQALIGLQAQANVGTDDVVRLLSG